MRSKKIGIAEGIFLFLNFLAILALLFSYGATVVNPVTVWYFALFGLAYPYILLINIVFIIIWVLFRKWHFLYSLVFIVIGYPSLNRTIGFRTANEHDFNSDSSSIKLMTWNVHYLKKFGSDLDSSTRAGIFNVIKEEQPDVVGFQEFFTRKRGIYDIKDSILKILDTKNYYYSKSIDNGYESTGVAVFSKFPILNSGEIKLEDENSGNKGIWIDIKKTNKLMRIYVVHLASISFKQEDYLFLNNIKKDINNGKDVNSSKRILKKLKIGFIKRSEELTILKTELSKCETPYILMGDFNDTPVSYTLGTLSADLKNGFYEKGSGFGLTYNGAFPNFQIDYILASQEFNFSTYKIIKRKYSDHYPIRSNVNLIN